MMGLVLWRREFLELRRSSGWILLFGRRKTGKSFIARLMAPWDYYATVTRDLYVVLESRDHSSQMLGLDEAIPILVKALRSGGLVVLDEFQRLPERYWSMIAMVHPEGRLVLAGSSLGVVERVFDRRSPLLGLLLPLRVDPIRVEDVIVSLSPRLPSFDTVLWSILLREPWLSPFVDLSRNPLDYLMDNVVLLSYTVRGLVGEVFLEEERELTRLYESILRLLGSGVWSSRMLANLLYSRGLLGSPSPGVVTGVLDKMARMGLVARTRLWRTRGGRIYYRHLSPLLSIIYGMLERHALDEVPAIPEKIRGTLEMLLAREAMFSLGGLLASYHQGIQAYTILGGTGEDVDVVILDKRGRQVLAAYEVKLGSCTTSDRRLLERRAQMIGARSTGLVCLRGGGDLDARDIVKLSRALVRNWLANMPPTKP